MVGIVVVSHSEKIAKGVKELAEQMAPNVAIFPAGGTSDGRIGTDMDKIINGVEEVCKEDGALIIFDLGSALMSAEMATEFISEETLNRLKIVDCPIVEGTVIAAVDSSIGKSLEEIVEALKPLKVGKM